MSVYAVYGRAKRRNVSYPGQCMHGIHLRITENSCTSLCSVCLAWSFYSIYFLCVVILFILILYIIVILHCV